MRIARFLCFYGRQAKSAWSIVAVFFAVVLFGSVVAPTDAGQVSDGSIQRDSTPRSFGSGAAGNPAVAFVGESTAHETAILDKNGKIIRRISATGYLQTDREGDVYIANPFGSFSVMVYAPPYNGKPMLLTPGSNQKILNVAIDQKTDIVVVTSQANDSHGGPTELRFYRHGETTACRHYLPYKQGLPDVSYLAFAADDTLYMIGNTGGGTVPASTGGGCNQSPTQIYQFGNTVSPFGYMAVDADDHFLVQSFAQNNKEGAIYTYALPVNGILQPLSKTVLGRGSAFLSMDSTGSHMWGVPLSVRTVLLLFNYPAGGAPVGQVSGLQSPGTMAVYPNYIPSAHRAKFSRAFVR